VRLGAQSPRNPQDRGHPIAEQAQLCGRVTPLVDEGPREGHLAELPGEQTDDPDGLVAGGLQLGRGGDGGLPVAQPATASAKCIDVVDGVDVLDFDEPTRR
jgi:hypothetical protein